MEPSEPRPMPAGGAPSQVQAPPLPVPAQVTVFGIMHLLLAVAGVVMVALSGLMQQFTAVMLADQVNQPGIAGAQARMQGAILEIGRTSSVVYYAGTLLLAVLLAVSGVLLLKRRGAGIKVSNTYAWCSITLKLVSLVVFFGWTMPKLDPVLNEVARETGPEGAMLGNVMRVSMVAGGVFSPVLMCVYPVLALVLLNRPPVKAALGMSPASAAG